MPGSIIWFFEETEAFFSKKQAYHLEEDHISMLMLITEMLNLLYLNPHFLPVSLQKSKTINQLETLHNTSSDFILTLKLPVKKDGASALFNNFKKLLRGLVSIIRDTSTIIILTSPGHNTEVRIEPEQINIEYSYLNNADNNLIKIIELLPFEES